MIHTGVVEACLGGDAVGNHVVEDALVPAAAASPRVAAVGIRGAVHDVLFGNIDELVIADQGAALEGPRRRRPSSCRIAGL
jgi:hypothetical protein